jgi:membrane fusion protein, multidrug efflux system
MTVKARLIAALGCCVAGLSGAHAQERSTAADMTARGVISPRIEATISAQISGRIARLTVDRGRTVTAGEVLVEFDCALEKVRLKAAQADLEGARAKLLNLQRLDRMGSVGKVEVQIAAAAADMAAAAVDERQTILRYCVVTAPFSGVVVDVPVHAHENVDAGKPLVSLLDDKSLRIVALAPSNWAAWLTPGMTLTFSVDETGERFPAQVSGLDGRIDPGSQTIAVFAQPKREQSVTPLISGMTGSAVFDVKASPPSLTQ